MHRNFARHLPAILASVVPLYVILKLVMVALYASPETDDYCFAFHYRDEGVARTIAMFYDHAIGRVVPMLLMMASAMASKASGVDLFVLYPLMMAAGVVAFVGVAIFAVGRLWTDVSMAQRIFMGLAMSAAVFSAAVSLREMLYWAPGVDCYLVPGTIVVIVFFELFESAARGSGISNVAGAGAGILCFLAAMCNEFTPLWLIAIVVASFIFRRFSSHPLPQARLHAMLLAITMIGFAVLLAAPGNRVRMGLYPANGKLLDSVSASMWFTPRELMVFFSEPGVVGWLLIVALFSAVVSPVRFRSRAGSVILALGTVCLLAGCVYGVNFVGYYATGEYLAFRARNEVIVLLVVGSTCAVGLVASVLADAWRTKNPAIHAGALLACGLLCLTAFSGRAMLALSSERSQLDVFWLESMARHALLKLDPSADIVVPNRTVRPSVLMAEDLTENPNRLPNDCVAAFYGKRSVIMRTGH
jgi:hypothetical protein